MTLQVVEKGDHYVPEVCASVQKVMQSWGQRCDGGKVDGLTGANKHVLAWQSKVGYLPWMVPKTSDVLENLGKKGERNVLVVPIAFTSDHIETLFEIGIEYKEDAEKAGVKNFKYTEGLNGSERFIESLAGIVKDHLDSGQLHSPQYRQKCVGCVKPNCRKVMNPAC
jgi:ferrochelatase